MIAIEIKDAKFQAEITTLAGQMKRPRALLAAVGREAQQQFKSHFRKKDRNEPNRLGGRRQHFWNQVADSTQNPVLEKEDTQVRVSITDPRIAQKVFGGRIVPKNVDNLTVPETAEAYGRTAETFEAETGLKLFLFTKKKGEGQNGFAALAAKVNGVVTVEYILRRWVDQQADADALPDMSEGSPFLQALLLHGRAVVERQAKDANQSGGTN